MNESRSFPEAESPLSECRPPLPHFLGVDSDRAEASSGSSTPHPPRAMLAAGQEGTWLSPGSNPFPLAPV